MQSPSNHPPRSPPKILTNPINAQSQKTGEKADTRGDCERSRTTPHLPQNTNIMKRKLEVVENLLIRLRDEATDDEVSDELDNALIHLDAAKDRLIALEEEEDPEAEIDNV